MIWTINPAIIIAGLIVWHMDVPPLTESQGESEKTKGFHTTPPDFYRR